MNIYEPYTKVATRPTGGTFQPRPEQSEAIEKAFKYFAKNEGSEFLWNAKMRFGKTVCALWLIEKLNKELGKKKVLIVTHRPVVNAEWYKDYTKILNDDEYSYGTAKETAEEQDFKHFSEIKQDAKAGKCVIFFASMHYLRLAKVIRGVGNDESPVKKAILDFDWDLVIIDEAHEGTQTNLGEGVINYLHKEKTYLLHLSGTPFNLLDKFKREQIYNWDYIKEQQTKLKWDEDHKKRKKTELFAEDEVNPYRELPKMEIMTFRIGEMTDEQAIIDAASGGFSFTEFFRVKTGHDVPKEERGKFLHEGEILKFLAKMWEPGTHYPFSCDEYRRFFRHTLWVVPGVPEARALKKLIEEKTPLPQFGFKVVNVAGNSEDDEQRGNALDKVFKAMKVDPKTDVDDSDQTYTITLSCGRLTTGVTVKPWTAVLYMKGSETTAASTYMQTIFRVQSPHTLKGMMKSKCYVFDFAPERALAMMAETAKYSRAFERKESKKDKKQKPVIDDEDKEKMRQLLEVCPVYETTNGCPPIINDGIMQPIDTEKLFKQLTKVYVDKVVRNGFDHPSLYKYEEFLKLDLEDEMNLNYIKGIFGDDRTDRNTGNNDVDVNHQDYTPEQLAAMQREKEEQDEAARKAREKAKKDYEEMLAKMTPEQRKKFLDEKAEHARKLKLIHQSKDKLTGLSKRIPLMMYGANVKDFKEVTIDTFTDRRFIDDDSWNEFMPNGVTRQLFKKLTKFYNEDVFKEAGVRIRQLAKEADSMKVEERIARIAQIFKWFKNPDKETVLTPWEVVNRHMSSTLGGYCFFEDDFKTPVIKIDKNTGEILETNKPRFVDRGEITKEVFGDVTSGNIDETNGKINTKILEINSKTGLYPLYVAYSLYKQLLPVWAGNDNPEDYSADDEHVVWDNVVSNNLYVICNTKMAERITRRTLLGFRETDSNGEEIKLNVKQDKLITRVAEDKDALVNDLLNERYWINNNMEMKTLTFNAVVGNPPYMETSNVNNRQNPIYHYFYDLAESLSDIYTLISPARFLFNAGLTPSAWNEKMLNNVNFKVVYYNQDATTCFPNTDIKGGIAITIHNNNVLYGAIRKFVPNNSLRSIASKFVYDTKNNLSKIVFSGRSDLKFNDVFLEAFPNSIQDRIAYMRIKRPAIQELGPNEEYELKSSSFEALPYVFEENVDKKDLYYHILGLVNAKREWKYIKKEYMTPRYPKCNNIDKYKVLVPESNGSGVLGEPLGKFEIGHPGDSSTTTFIGIGAFDTLEEANNCATYLKTKFVRCLLGILKITQHNPQTTWAYVPMQDFSPSSDITWSSDVSDVEKQLYSKYKELLTEEDINFIESEIKEMD